MNNPIRQAFDKANQLAEQNQLDTAEQIYQQLLAQIPQHHGAWHGLGIIAFKRGQYGQAIELVIKAIRINSGIGLYHRNLAELFRLNGNLDKAILAAENATTLMPDDAASFYNLAIAYAEQGRHDDAELCYKQVLSIQPDHTMALNNLGNVYSEQGKMDEAKECFNEAIMRKPDSADAHYNLSALKTYTPDDEQYNILKSLESNADSMPAQSQIHLYFALGKAHEDCKHYSDAFAAYDKGNRIYHSTHSFNENSESKNHHAVKNVFTAEFMEKHHGAGLEQSDPVFIVGMLRSGTTLVEQILSSHSKIAGAGEVPELTQVIDVFAGGKGKLFYPQHCSSDDWARMGKLYLEKLEKYRDSPDVQWVSNKTLSNFLHLGMIKLMFPNARIIHVLRDPMDACFSCYAKLFSSDVGFSYNLEELGRYYVRYRQMMEYWENILPAGSIHTIHYEDLIKDFEPQARALIQYIGAEWEESCLTFQNNKRKVFTASIAQVRKPLYTTSVARWEHFSDQLQPLMEIVKDYR